MTTDNETEQGDGGFETIGTVMGKGMVSKEIVSKEMVSKVSRCMGVVFFISATDHTSCMQDWPASRD